MPEVAGAGPAPFGDSPGVVVFGSINMDVVTYCQRHPQIGETVLGSSVAFHPGGKGENQAIAAARCSGKSVLIGSVGADDFGKRMLAYLGENGVDVAGVAVESGSATGVAVINVDAQGNNTIVVTPGANALAKAPARLPAAPRSRSRSWRALLKKSRGSSPISERPGVRRS